MGRGSLRGWSLGFAAVVLFAAVGSPAPVAAASDQFQDSAVKTYELRPDRGVVHVTVQFTFKNRAPSTSRSWDCSTLALDPYGNTYVIRQRCSVRTDYYYDWYDTWVERDARAFKATASAGSVSIKPRGRKGEYRIVRLNFTPLYYGKTRKVTFSYDLPAGGPRSSAERRVGYAFSRFCAAGPGTDAGQMRVVVPAGFEMTLTDSMRSSTSGKKRIYDTGYLTTEPWEFYTCLDGRDPKGFTSTPVTASDGSTVTVEAWKEDTAWAKAVQAAVSEDLPKLRTLLGDPPVGSDFTIREQWAERTRIDDLDRHTHFLSESAASRPAVTADLARLWFGSTMLRSDWLIEGYAAWAQQASGVSDASCDKPAAGTEVKELDRWTVGVPSSSAAALATAATQRQAACHLISEVARGMGPERMAETIALIRNGLDAWSPSGAPAQVRTEAFHWRTWLDIVTERGLVPAGADTDFVSDLLVEYGIAGVPEQLDRRDAAHDAYHDLLGLLGDRPAPTAVTTPLSTWDFAAATAAIDTATKAWTDVASVTAALPDVVVDGAAVQQAIAAATTREELSAAAELAATQADLATRVSEALAAQAAPRDPLQSVGLIGTAMPDPARMIDAVARIDAPEATGAADAFSSTFASARDVGLQRALAALGLVVVLVAVGWFVRRRTRRRLQPPGDAPPLDDALT